MASIPKLSTIGAANVLSAITRIILINTAIYKNCLTITGISSSLFFPIKCETIGTIARTIAFNVYITGFQILTPILTPARSVGL